jgi:endonuclease/exonuclease/phosphatase family metal-dependent hydrolase
VLTVVTYNLFEFGAGTAAANARRDDVVEVARAADAHLLAVQEVCGEDQAATLDQLAADIGLCCRLDGQPTLACNGGKYATAVLWHPDLKPTEFRLPGIGGTFERRIACITLTIGGRRLAFASYHATPAGSYQRIDDAVRVAMCMTRGRGFDAAVVGGDFNDTSAAKTPEGSYLDPDWTQTNPWNTNFIYETQWEYQDGHRHQRPDRRPADTLEQGGLPDAAGLLQTSPQPTDGHWPNDWSHNRRKARFHVTADLKPALRNIDVIRNETTLRASDHLPVVLTLDGAAFSGNQASAEQ